MCDTCGCQNNNEQQAPEAPAMDATPAPEMPAAPTMDAAPETPEMPAEEPVVESVPEVPEANPEAPMEEPNQGGFMSKIKGLFGLK